MYHGIQKLSNMEMTIGFFGMMGLSAFWAWVTALVETIGGAMVVIGMGVRIWASLLTVIMIVVLFIVDGGFMAKETVVILLGLSLGVALMGCGKWSVCRMWHAKGTCKVEGDHCGCNCPDHNQ